MHQILDWVVQNKQWLFSGVGIVIVSWLGRLIYRRAQSSSVQTIHSGRNSINVVAGKNAYVSTAREKRDVNQE